VAVLGDDFARLEDIDVGDHVEARGPVIITKSGELSIDLHSLRGVGKALMLASVLLVLIVELLNSAVEATVDRISLENHQLADGSINVPAALRPFLGLDILTPTA